MRKKTAIVLKPLQALLATCNDGVRGIRDGALLLLARSGGGRRRLEVVGLQVGDVRKLDAETWFYTLGITKTDISGTRAKSRRAGRRPRRLPLAAWLGHRSHPALCFADCTRVARLAPPRYQQIKWRASFSAVLNCRGWRVIGPRTV